jgi:hypothetical protein
MEGTGAAYLYTIAVIGITFIGFSAIVMMLRQTSGRPMERFDILIAHVYMEFGLIVSVGSLLPPLFSFWGLRPEMVWRVSSALVGAALLLFSLTYRRRRRKALGEPLPWYTKTNIAVIVLVGVVFVGNACGIAREKMPAIYLSAITAFMTFAIASWLRALSIIFLEKSPPSRT